MFRLPLTSPGRTTRRKLLAGVAGAATLGVGTCLRALRGEAAPHANWQGKLLRIGYAVERPYAYLSGSGLTGACPETSRLVAARMGIHPEWIQTPFESLIPDLLEGRFDLVSSGLFVSEERTRIVRFARPELRVAAGLLIRRGNPHAPHSYPELSPARRVAVVSGTVEQSMLQGLGGPELLKVPDSVVGAKAVQVGSADALALSWPGVQVLASRDASLEPIRIEDPAMGSLVATAFRHRDARLARAWNTAEDSVLGTPPHLQAIAAFGFGLPDLPTHAREA